MGGGYCKWCSQSDWCNSEMSCHEDSNELCQVQHWCVCQWAFASYVENSGGCDAIQDIVCDAINVQAVLAYQKHGNNQKYQNALDCLVERCGIEISSSYIQNMQNLLQINTVSNWKMVGVVSGMVLIVGIVFLKKYRMNIKSLNDSLLS